MPKDERDEGKGQAGGADEQTQGQGGQADGLAPKPSTTTGQTETLFPPPLEQYASPEQSGRQNTQDWDADELMDERLNEQIRQAQENNSWGSIAGRLRERIIASLKPKLDYRGVLRQFRTSILSVNRVLTRMKPSRRYGFLYLGSRRDFTTHLLFAVDVSGSVSSDDLARGFSVLNRFFKYGIESIEVIQFDTEIKGPPLPLKKAQREVKVLGRGGTSFIPVIDYIDEHRHYDGLLIFTDGDAPMPPKPQNRRTRVLWLFNQESNYERIHKELRLIGRAAFLKED